MTEPGDRVVPMRVCLTSVKTLVEISWPVVKQSWRYNPLASLSPDPSPAFDLLSLSPLVKSIWSSQKLVSQGTESGEGWRVSVEVQMEDISPIAYFCCLLIDLSTPLKLFVQLLSGFAGSKSRKKGKKYLFTTDMLWMDKALISQV